LAGVARRRLPDYCRKAALVAADHPDARSERVEGRGRDEPVDVDVLKV
jgi:hypothetical protein